jgi:hypothetical protein
MTNEQIAHYLVTQDKATVKYVVLPNLLKANPPMYPDYPNQIVIAICDDCKAELPKDHTSQFCKCGAMVYPF